MGVRQGNQSLTVAVNGPLILDDVETMIRAAVSGVGLAFTLEEHVAPTSRVGYSCACSKIGARRSRAIFCITRAGGSSRPHSQLSSKLFACSCNGRKKRFESGLPLDGLEAQISSAASDMAVATLTVFFWQVQVAVALVASLERVLSTG